MEKPNWSNSIEVVFFLFYYYSYGIHWHGTNRTLYYLLSYTLSI
jgi:hypothetical protein